MITEIITTAIDRRTCKRKGKKIIIIGPKNATVPLCSLGTIEIDCLSKSHAPSAIYSRGLCWKIPLSFSQADRRGGWLDGRRGFRQSRGKSNPPPPAFLPRTHTHPHTHTPPPSLAGNLNRSSLFKRKGHRSSM